MATNRAAWTQTEGYHLRNSGFPSVRGGVIRSLRADRCHNSFTYRKETRSREILHSFFGPAMMEARFQSNRDAGLPNHGFENSRLVSKIDFELKGL
jgi:hypothetical protein